MCRWHLLFRHGQRLYGGDNANTSGTYTMTTGSNPLAFTLTPSGPTANSYAVGETNPIDFMYSSSGADLTGNLSFLAAENGPVNSAGNSLVFLGGSFAITGGSLSGDFAKTVPADVTLVLYNCLSSLINGTMTLSAQVETGDIATPEPGSIFLFGTGLLALGFLLERRRTLSFTQWRECVRSPATIHSPALT